MGDSSWTDDVVVIVTSACKHLSIHPEKKAREPNAA
jgi:hypothetical protein